MMKRILLGLLCASMSLCAVAQNRVTKVLIPGARGLLAAEVQMPENKGNRKMPYNHSCPRVRRRQKLAINEIGIRLSSDARHCLHPVRL